jgi:cytochrome c biogenesis protein CcmG, thiol:disulfide interchange protein DsbE
MTNRSSRNEQGRATIDGIPWNVVVVIILLAVVFWLFMTRRAPEPATSHPAVGRPAPTLDLVQLIPVATRGEDDLAGELQEPVVVSGLPPAGAVTLLHFWGTWCPPCKVEYPELVELAHEMEGKPGFRFASVSCGAGAGEDFDSLQSETLRYYTSIGAGELMTFADLGGETRRSAAQQLGGSIVYPTTILVSPEQRIAAVWLGYSPAGVGEMREAALKLMPSQN